MTLAPRRLLTWIAIPLLVAQVGCAARGVRVPADPRSATVSEAERAKCDAFAQEEAKTAGTNSVGKAFGEGGRLLIASGSLADIVLVPLGITLALLVGTINAASAGRKNADERDAAYARAMELCLNPASMEQRFGPEHPELARSLEALAARYVAQGKFAEAEPLYQRALAIEEKALGLEGSDVATTLESYAAVLRKMNREAEAEPMEARAKVIRTKHEQEQEQRAPTQAPGNALSRSGITFGEPCAPAVVSTLDKLNERVTAQGGRAQIVAAECYVDGTLGKLRFKTQDDQEREVVLSPTEAKEIEAIMWRRLLSGAP
jgi:tetratricopeptide (TPR) repeat protein